MAMLPGQPVKRRKEPAKGSPHRGGKRIVILFDDETLSAVDALAAKDDMSFAEKVRQLVEWGLLEFG